jgi:hypothetical protein
MRALARQLLWAVIAIYTLYGFCKAQEFPSTLLGTVVSPSGRPLPKVRLQLSKPRERLTIASGVSDSKGRFAFAGLSSGAYSLDVIVKGRPSQRANLSIPSASTLTLRIEIASARPPVARATRIEPRWGKAFTSTSMQQLPNSRSIWSLLESQEPSAVTSHLDVGELETGSPALFGALGASWTENRYSLDGFDETDPYASGEALIDPGISALAGVEVMTAAKPASMADSGTEVAIEAPAERHTLHGSAQFFYSGRALQSDNMDRRLRELRFPGPERMNNLEDFSGELGGELPSAGDGAPFFVSGFTQQLRKTLGGFPASIQAHVNGALAELTPFHAGSKQWNLLYAGQQVFDSRQGASLLTAPSSTTIGDRSFNQFQTWWNEAFGARRLVRAGFGVSNAVISSGLQNGISVVSTLNLPAMQQSGVAPVSLAGLRTIYQGNLLFETAAGAHNFEAGSDWERSDIANRWSALDNGEEILVSGNPSELVRWNTPAQARDHVQNLALFAQDAWQPAAWLSFSPGLRVDRATGRATAGRVGIEWTTVEPRAGFAVLLRKHGPLLRASWSRYAHQLQGRYLDFGNPAALGAQVFGDGASVGGAGQPLEAGQRLKVFGGPYSGIDPRLAYPFTDEITAGLEQNFRSRVRASLRLFRRDDHRLIGIRNQGVPFSDYTPVQFLDPGNDGIPGTSDDQLLTLYDENPAALGRDFLLLTNPGLKAHAEAFEIRLTSLTERRLHFSASFLGTETLATTSPGNSVFENDTGVIGTLGIDPNTFLMATGRTYFDRAFVGKLTTYYELGHGFYVAAVGKYYDGLPFGRLLLVNGFNQGPFFVMATPRGHPGGFQTQYNSTLDLRLARNFHLLRGRLSAYLDVFNALNTNNNTVESPLTGPAFQSRIPLAIEPPRIVRLGIVWSF